MIKSNRHFYKNFKKKNEFIYSLNLSYNADLLNDDSKNSTSVPVPLFAGNMFETLYNEITNNLGNAKPVSTGVNVGVANYGGNIWDAFAGIGGGGGFLNHTCMFPYNGFDTTGSFFTNDFYMKIATGSVINPNEQILSGWIKIVSMKMAYLNMMRTIQFNPVHCSNINFQWWELPSFPTDLKNNPITFFDQRITGNVYTNEEIISRYLKPSNQNSQKINVQNGFIGNLTVNYYNVDIPCDWVLSGSSGVAINWDCVNADYITQGQGDPSWGMNVNFTLHEIE